MSKGSDAGASPINPAAEKAAVAAWLDHFEKCNPGRVYAEYARALKALLAEPRLPAEPDYATWQALYKGWASTCADGRGADWMAAYRALYAHLTAPKTKTVEVWHCESAVLVDAHRGWSPHVSAHDTKQSAQNAADCLGSGDAPGRKFRCIHVTGPHKQEVPND